MKTRRQSELVLLDDAGSVGGRVATGTKDSQDVLTIRRIGGRGVEVELVSAS